MNEFINYMGYQWLQESDGLLTIGINEEGLSELGENLKVHLPEIDGAVEPGQVCGEIETESGQMNLYCPVDGHVVEINEAVIENPDLLFEDCMDEGWLFKVEIDDPENFSVMNFDKEDDEHE